MNADKIERLRSYCGDEATPSFAWVSNEDLRLMREAADELERLGKIEAAANDLLVWDREREMYVRAK